MKTKCSTINKKVVVARNAKATKQKHLPKPLLKPDQSMDLIDRQSLHYSQKCDYSSNYNGIYLPNIIFQQEDENVVDDSDFHAQA